MAIYSKSNHAPYCTLVVKSKVLSYTIALCLAFAPSSHHLMNLCTYVIMISIYITSYALFITIKRTLANHTQ